MAASSGRHPDNSPVGPTFDDDDEDDELPTMLGDVLICPAVAARHAPEHAGDHHDGSVEDELALLVVHGILHLIGHDHAEADEALRMREREVALLAAHHRGAVGSDTDVDGGEPAGDELDADIVDGTEP
jgi:probable rRNA maturation factor